MLQIPEQPRDLGDWKRSHHHRYSFSQLWALGLLHRAGAVFILSCQEEEKAPLAQLILKILGALLALNFVPSPGTGRGSLKAVYHHHVGSSQKEEGCCGQRQPCTPARGVLRWKRSEEEECLPRVSLIACDGTAAIWECEFREQAHQSAMSSVLDQLRLGPGTNHSLQVTYFYDYLTGLAFSIIKSLVRTGTVLFSSFWTSRAQHSILDT